MCSLGKSSSISFMLTTFFSLLSLLDLCFTGLSLSYKRAHRHTHADFPTVLDTLGLLTRFERKIISQLLFYPKLNR